MRYYRGNDDGACISVNDGGVERLCGGAIGLYGKYKAVWCDAAGCDGANQTGNGHLGMGWEREKREERRAKGKLIQSTQERGKLNLENNT